MRKKIPSRFRRDGSFITLLHGFMGVVFALVSAFFPVFAVVGVLLAAMAGILCFAHVAADILFPFVTRISCFSDIMFGAVFPTMTGISHLGSVVFAFPFYAMTGTSNLMSIDTSVPVLLLFPSPPIIVEVRISNPFMMPNPTAKIRR